MMCEPAAAAGRWVVLGVAVAAVALVACRDAQQPTGPALETQRDAARLLVSLGLDASAPAPEERFVGSQTACAVPIRASVLPTRDLPGEQGMLVTLSRSGQVVDERTTNPAGVAFLTSDQAGLHRLTLSTGDKLVRARLTVELRSERTLVSGYVARDEQDWDGDNDRLELTLVAEVLPDVDADRISDTGAKALWACDAGGGVVFWHLGGGLSERGLLSAEHTVQQSSTFADQDGDWIADADDPDTDGDGILNVEEATPLPCPAFAHADLQIPGSKHETMPCLLCHDAQDPLPLACHDCHHEAGRQWLNTPDNAPAGHFEVDCEQCHAADRPWAEVSHGGGKDHSIYPLTGAHLTVRCFACHATGNVEVPHSCNDCHRADAPADHYQGECTDCHTTQTWEP